MLLSNKKVWKTVICVECEQSRERWIVPQINITIFDVFMCRLLFLVFILFFPVIFTIGLLPQVDTFIIYAGEQIDINIFGGTGKQILL